MSTSVLAMFINEWGITKTAQVVLCSVGFACIGFILSSSFIKNEKMEECLYD